MLFKRFGTLHDHFGHMKFIRYCVFCWQVSLPVVRRFVQAVSDQAVGVGLIRGVRPDQQLVKVKLTVTMGNSTQKSEQFTARESLLLLAV